jgi:hypothetical protein
MLQCDILLRGEVANGLQGSGLLAYGRRVAGFKGDADEWLCSRFGAESQRIASYCALGDGLDVSTGYWWNSDPVHLALMRDSLVLTGTPRDISPAHAQHLVEALNRHFSADRMRWFQPHPGRWYLRMESGLGSATISKQLASGKKIEKSQGQAQWAATLNEIQMLLHQHAANAEREAHGLMPVNSVWLWGGGEYQPPASQPYTVVLANAPLLRGLAQQRCHPLPDAAQNLPEGQACLVVLDETNHAHQGQEWAATLLSMLKQDRLKTIHVHLEQDGNIDTLELMRQDLWKFWRSWKFPGSFKFLRPVRFP